MADKNWFSLSGEVGDRQLGLLLPPADFAPWSDTLKFSAAYNGDVHAIQIQGGKEDCVDINNGCHDLKVYCAEYDSGGNQVFTIKGGANNIWISGIIYTHGKVVDVDIDNYSDQSHKASSRIYLNLRTKDGSPVTWRSLKGCKPEICNPEQAYKCKLYLPWIVGIAWDRLYQLGKILGLCA